MNMDRVWVFAARTGYVFYFLAWLTFGGIAAFWWLPHLMGAHGAQMLWKMGAVCLVAQWIFIFNHWPRLGTRRFFQESRFLKIEVAFLVLISGLFALGFAIAA